MPGLTGPLGELGEYIREQRVRAQISLRQLAAQAGVSNPYLSQIERGLRKPSAEVLQQIASALRISTPIMYLRAGLLDGREEKGVHEAVTADPVLTDRQKQILIEVYESFVRANSAVSTVDDPAVAEVVADAEQKISQESESATDPAAPAAAEETSP
ncbi:helix-turn-helix domain-containing protein [Fodinicola acaciae]|uniref:helix-turn-helix domain-containing protein n=1 Tax=Fodinicola acaciae TaxID=2681555 RepID=UPI0013CF871B|nr:helix-turn-helix transcriptional regulator [Fodinicola acaciae]